MARVMPLLLTMKRWPVPDLDAVFSGTDYPIMEVPRDAAHMKRLYGPQQAIPPLFADDGAGRCRALHGHRFSPLWGVYR